MASVKKTLHISADQFAKIGRMTGVIVFIAFFILVWYGFLFYDVMLFVLWLGVMYLLKTLVDEPIIDERIVEIQRASATGAAQIFSLILMLLIIVGPFVGMNKNVLGTLEFSLGLFLLLKLVMTRYYERVI